MGIIYIYITMKKMCHPGCHHNGFAATYVLGQMTPNRPHVRLYTYIYIYIYIYIYTYIRTGGKIVC